MALCGCRSGHP